jgi:hypothetical protein
MKMAKVAFPSALVFLLMAIATSCGKPAPVQSPAQSAAVKKVPRGQQNSGFLKDYSQLKPNPALEGESLTYVNTDEQKNLHKYVAMIVDPVEVYVSTDVDESQIPEGNSKAAAEYFRHALIRGVSDVFPVVDTPGPLVLRLRSAIVGVDAGSAPDKNARALNIGKVIVEMELVDSETGDLIAAAVDKVSLGAGAEVGSENFSREEKYARAKEAFDGWAARVRQFLDASEELKGDDARRADESYRPYGK